MSLQTTSFTGTVFANHVLYRNNFFKHNPLQEPFLQTMSVPGPHFFQTDSFTGPVFTKNLPADNIVSKTERLFHPV